MNKIKIFVPVLSMFFVFTACNQAEQQAQETTQSDSINLSKPVEIELKDPNVDMAYNQYLQLKDVLVLSDSVQTRNSAKLLVGHLAKITGYESTAKLANDIANESSLSKQRILFTSLSNELIIMFKKAEITSGSMFVQYCPMANEGEGGYWLASETEIRNPYYGDEMLNCGEVKETIEKK